MTRSLPLAALTLALALGSAPSAYALDVGEVRDLEMGEALFYYYQDNWFPAITSLKVARHKGRLDDHGEDAELLLGGLYLSYGMHDQAGAIFHRLLADSVEPAVRDQAWYFLARIRYERGYYAEALAALRQIGGSLPKGYRGRLMMLQSQVLLAEGRLDEAVEFLKGWSGDDRYLPYARFNLGVALVRVGRAKDGVRFLDKVGEPRAEGAERKALRDKANLSLGFALLNEEQPDRAKDVLSRVRLNGPYSARALLGMGWADSQSGRYKRALVPWLELQERDAYEWAVQESLLAVPYAYGQLQANRSSVNNYLAAVNAYHNELERLDAAIEAVEGGRLVNLILSLGKASGEGWYWRMPPLPDAPESRYLYQMMAGHEFQEALKNLRDLRYLAHNLDEWTASLGSFDDILATRRKRFARVLPAIETSLAGVSLDWLDARRSALAERFRRIEESGDVTGLATPEEQAKWEQLARIGEVLERHGDHPMLAKVRERHRRLTGVLYWQMHADWPERRWREEKGLRQLERLMVQATHRRDAVTEARENAPLDFVDYETRIAAMSQRVADVRARVAAAADAQDRHLQRLAIVELEKRKRAITGYLSQARFALATMYDRAALAEASQ